MEDTPALFDHCNKVYSAMLEGAEEHESGNLHIWEGYLTHLFKDIGYGIPRYSRIVGMMQQMGCIEQIERGAGNKPSRWYLHKAPSLGDFEFAKSKETDRANRPTPIEQRVKDLINLVSEHQGRIDTLEQLVSQLIGDSDA